jgi:hypothetical protein
MPFFKPHSSNYIDEMEKCLLSNPGHCVTQFQVAAQHCLGRFTVGKTVPNAAERFAHASVRTGFQKREQNVFFSEAISLN